MDRPAGWSGNGSCLELGWELDAWVGSAGSGHHRVGSGLALDHPIQLQKGVVVVIMVKRDELRVKADGASSMALVVARVQRKGLSMVLCLVLAASMEDDGLLTVQRRFEDDDDDGESTQVKDMVGGRLVRAAAGARMAATRVQA
ncbi:hypothetical protein V6N11_010659 [Hibiscus sabdariffa]|uniref:Uncharacterized protein n=1 Tax=Hibiscus sabdariffa TaxID=183260 RepID=A0ABR2S5X5_9ROSI